MFEDMLIFRLTGKYKLLIQESALIADAFRASLLRLCEMADVRPEPIIGETNNPHLGLLPLPFVGPNGNGHVYGLAVAIPKGLSVESKTECLNIVRQVDKIHYRNEFFDVSVVNDAYPALTLRENTWRFASRHWATVTPMEVRWGGGNEEFIRQEVERLGLPSIESINVTQYELFHGSRRAKDFVSRNSVKQGRQAGFMTHAEITFSEPVVGPIALGRGRNFGLGLFKPIRA
jgi:CRISPR-associated protein Csb2